MLKKQNNTKHGQPAKWLCLCNCGKEKMVNSYDLRAKKVKSCGCYHSERLSKRNTIHGLSSHPLYAIWLSMNNRCYNINDKRFKNYGERGIKIEWASFLSFFRDMSRSYSLHKKRNKSTTIDRIDNNSSYSKKNCRWVTNKENCNNRLNLQYINRKRNKLGQYK